MNLVSALLALILSALAVTAKLQQDTIELKKTLGNSEAGIFSTLDKSVKNLIDDQLFNMLNGANLTVNAVNIPLDVSTPALPVYNVTIAQMLAMGFLPAGWNTTTSTLNGGTYKIRVTRLPVGCVFPACTLDGMVWLDRPVAVRGSAGSIDGKIVGAIFNALGANAGVSQIQAPGNIAGYGNTWAQANPVAGSPPGIVALHTTGLYQPNFLRIQDPRDPHFTGDVSIGDMTNPCIHMGGVIGSVSDGRAGFACANKDDLPAGYRGGVRSVDVVSSANILVSSSPGAFTGTNTNYALLTARNSAGVAEMRTSGRAAADRLTPLGSYGPGVACDAADEGSIARNNQRAGLLVCQGSVWVPMQTAGVNGSPCAPAGAIGTSQAGLGLYCQAGFWVLMSDRFGRYAVTDTYTVTNGTVVPKPVCPAAGTAKAYFNPQGIDTRMYSATSASTNFRATDNGGSYTIIVDNTIGSGASLGTPTNGYGLFIVGCFYN